MGLVDALLELDCIKTVLVGADAICAGVVVEVIIVQCDQVVGIASLAGRRHNKVCERSNSGDRCCDAGKGDETIWRTSLAGDRDNRSKLRLSDPIDDEVAQIALQLRYWCTFKSADQ